MKIKFTKMQGIGNDYIYVDCTKEQISDPAALAIRLSDRHYGIGSDGLILILPSEKADFRMRMFNADGGEAEMCGNGIRCVGKYVHDRGLTKKTEVTIETGAGNKTLRLNLGPEGQTLSVQVDMGIPELRPEIIPMNLSLPQSAGEQVIAAPMSVAGREFRITCVNMGNPHCVIFQEQVEDWPIEHWGPMFENSGLFPERVNTEFARVQDREHIRMRVWERGSGETLACGTGACATLVAGVLNGLTERRALLHLNGGDLEIEWNEKTGHVLMTGPAEFVFDGEID